MESNTKQLVNSDLCAVVTGANKGIGLATVHQLAQQGITVILTARNKEHGVESLKKNFKLSNVIFHQLDVQDSLSIANLTQFVEDRFGKLDILVNNAGTLGVSVDEERLKALNISSETWISGKAASLIQGVVQQTYDDAVTCLDTNYYGCKRATEALLSLLQLSTSGARIVNISSQRSEVKGIPDEKIRHELSDIENLNEERIEKLLENFWWTSRKGSLNPVWSTTVPAYNISKAVLNAYTRLLAKRYLKMHINCVHPGYVKTNINWNSGVITPEEGAKGPVMLALLPDGGPSGRYFDQTSMAEFCKGLKTIHLVRVSGCDIALFDHIVKGSWCVEFSSI